MSRGDRIVTPGNLLKSMRNNYEEHGVEEYYRKVGSTYRNPHFPGVRLCIFFWLNRWWQTKQPKVTNMISSEEVLIFDMACGLQVRLTLQMSFHAEISVVYPVPHLDSGEATLSVAEWWRTGKDMYIQYEGQPSGQGRDNQLLRRKFQAFAPLPLSPEAPNPRIIAADPYTSEAYRDRTSLPCAALSFKNITEGALPTAISDLLSTLPIPDLSTNPTPTSCEPLSQDEIQHNTIEMVICSFALHLIENPSELFSLLWELSTKSRWLVILAPHKKPELKEGWGWSKWNIHSWEECRMNDHRGELLHDRVHCRIYRSLNI